MPDKTVGIFSLDPGTTTGVAYTPDPVPRNTRPADALNNVTVEHVDCTDEFAGALTLMRLWDKVNEGWDEHDLPHGSRYLVYEDFILRPGKNHSSVRTGLSPVRVIAYLQGLLWTPDEVGPNYVYQQPAMAKQRWTNERLRRAGLWTVGKEHGRDATRHLALFYVQRMC